MDLKELLGEELYNQVMGKVGDKHEIAIVSDGNWFPKNKFDEVNEQKNEYKKMVDERDKQLEGLKEKAKGHDDLTAKLTELENQNKQTKEEYEAKMAELKKNTAIDLFLSSQKAKNVKAVKALLDMQKVSIDGDNLIGIEEQLKTLKEAEPYLFGDTKTTVGGGSNPPNATDYETNPWKPDTFNLTMQGKIMREDPAQAEKLRKAAGVK